MRELETRTHGLKVPFNMIYIHKFCFECDPSMLKRTHVSALDDLQGLLGNVEMGEPTPQSLGLCHGN